jgi:hypothetical protein
VTVYSARLAQAIGLTGDFQASCPAGYRWVVKDVHAASYSSTAGTCYMGIAGIAIWRNKVIAASPAELEWQGFMVVNAGEFLEFDSSVSCSWIACGYQLAV